nr:hypothetical protein KPHV_01200 [Kitasatospora purpeofusca]
MRHRMSMLAVAALTVAGSAVLVPPREAVAASGPTDHVLFWNKVLLDAYRQTRNTGPGPLAHAGAVMHTAIWDAVDSVVPAADRRFRPYRTVVPAPGTASVEAAIDQAAHDTLTGLFPGFNPGHDFAADFRQALATARATIPASATETARDQGAAVGSEVARVAIGNRPSTTPAWDPSYTLDSVPGAWRPTDPGQSAPTNPNWGLLAPFAMTSGAQFRPQPPAQATSYAALLADPAYAAQVNEVKSLGSATSTTRTADQTKQAFFWANDVDGTYKPPGQLFDITRTVAQQKGLIQTENARLFALVAVALADASIVAWDAKYASSIDLWRPQSAIRLADPSTNPAITPDPAWQPLSVNRAGQRFSPPFPAYVSGHATFGAAWAGVMRGIFGDQVTFTATTDDPQAVGATRTFTTFTAAAQENALSRIYLGVHYRWDADAGVAAGNSLGAYVRGNVLTPAPAYVPGAGWTFAGTADYDGDGHSDTIARDDASGSLYLFPGAGDGYSSRARVEIGTGWNNATFAGVADYTGDGKPDVVSRNNGNGSLYVHPGTGGTGYLAGGVEIGSGWQNFTFAGVADYTGDGKPDVVTRNNGNGNLYVYPGAGGTGQVTAAVEIGSGWQNFTFAGVADYTGDGKPDVVTRNNGNGSLYVYPGAGGTGQVTAAVEIGSGWQNFTFAGVADYTGDGKPDVVTRNNGNGNLYVYPGAGGTGQVTAAREIGNGW